MLSKRIKEQKKLESSPKVVSLFLKKEIDQIIDLYNSLPTTVYNKKQNVLKKKWIQDYNKFLDNLYLSKLREVLGDFEMDNNKSDNGKDFFGIFHESYSPLKLHVDSGFDENIISYKQVLVPMSNIGETVIFENRWYGNSTNFTIDESELKTNNHRFKSLRNKRSSEHINMYGKKNFNSKDHQRYLQHEDINNLRGLKILMVYKWKIGQMLIFDRSHLHCSSSKIKNKKLGLSTFTKKNTKSG